MIEECPRCRVQGMERTFTDQQAFEIHIMTHELMVLNKSLEKLIGWFLESSKRYVSESESLR